MQRISRKEFLKAAAIGTAGLGILGVGGAAMAEEAVEWAEAADMIVVGGGGAGFAAAIEAGRAGVSVLILEKNGMCGGDTLLSNGMLMAAGTELQKTLGKCETDSAEKFAEQQVIYAQGYGNADMIREMCMESSKAIDFMVEQGRVYKHVDIIPPVWDFDTEDSWAPRSHWDNSESGAGSTGHFLLLLQTVEGMDNVKYHTETEVAHLLTDEAGEVIGVSTVDGVNYRANKAVLLATASWGGNMEMAKSYNPMQYWVLSMVEKYQASFHSHSVGNTGDGIRMAQELGADLALSPANVTLDPIYTGGVGEGRLAPLFGVDYINEYNSISIPGSILVNNKGQRFVQEDALWGYVNQEVFNEAQRTNWTAESDIKVWYIQDAANLANSPIVQLRLMYPETNFAKLVQTADTIEELAAKIKVPVENLKETVARWNGFCKKGADADFNRKVDFGTIEAGPFYALPFIPQSLGSLGGVKTDIETRVLDVNGEPIPRLYAAGTVMSGNWCGPFYSSCGWAVLGTVHWGRKAGRNIAALEPLEA